MNRYESADDGLGRIANKDAERLEKLKDRVAELEAELRQWRQGDPAEGVGGCTVKRAADTPLSRACIAAVIDERIAAYHEINRLWRERKFSREPKGAEWHPLAAVEVLEELRKALGME